jgi:hypothetical protein
VPSEKTHTFKFQALKGKDKGEWAEKVDQYVLGLVGRKNCIRDETLVERTARNHLGTGGASGTALNICLRVLLTNLVRCVGSDDGRGRGR